MIHSTNLFCKKNRPTEVGLSGAEDRNRTGTVISNRRILSPLRLPVPPPRHGWNFVEAAPRIELGNKGFADLCLTAWLCRQKSGAENEIRTRDPRLGKAVLYR